MPVLTSFDGTWVNDAAVSLDAGELRRADATLFASGGVVRGLEVSVDASDVVTVQPGCAVIDGDDYATGIGVYRGGTTAAAVGSLDARDATNSRIDLVVFRQLDDDVVASHDAHTQRIEIITGTPSATPSAPALPSLAVELARITVPVSGGAAATVNSSNRVSAAAAGADVTVPHAWTGNVTTDASGYATVTHGAPFTPAAAAVTLATTAAMSSIASWAYDNLGATTVRLRCVKSDGTVAAAVTVPVSVVLFP